MSNYYYDKYNGLIYKFPEQKYRSVRHPIEDIGSTLSMNYCKCATHIFVKIEQYDANNILRDAYRSLKEQK